MTKFAQRYVENGGNGVEACEFAGYNGTRKSLMEMASRLLKHFEIKDYIAKKAEKACKKNDITVEKVLDDLSLAKQIALGWETEVTIDEETGETRKGYFNADLKHFLKSIELEGKYLKMFTNVDVNLTGKIDHGIDLAKLPKDALEKILKALDEAGL